MNLRAWSVDLARPIARRWLGWVLLVIGTVAVAGAAAWYQHELLLLRHKEAQRTEILAQQDAVMRSESQRTQILSQAPAYAQDPRWLQALQALDWPWLDVLGEIERATQPPVYLLTFKPDLSAGLIHLECEADAFDDVITYLKALQGANMFADVRLVRHEESKDSQGRVVVRFNVEFRLKPLRHVGGL